jgi:hypothetical protein
VIADKPAWAMSIDELHEAIEDCGSAIRKYPRASDARVVIYVALQMFLAEFERREEEELERRSRRPALSVVNGGRHA